MNTRCIPVCKSCREAGTCHRIPKQQQWKPDRLTGKRMQCKHIIDVIPIVQGIVDLKGHCIASHVWCEVCRAWQPLRWKDELPQTHQDELFKDVAPPF